MKMDMHVYECGLCGLTFGVDANFEDQEDIVCPICLGDDGVDDVGYAKDVEVDVE